MTRQGLERMIVLPTLLQFRCSLKGSHWKDWGIC